MNAESESSIDADSPDIRTRARAAADEVQRELVADAVCRVIATEGLDAASLRRVATELGCTTRLISHYLASKEELLIQALQHATRLLGATVESDLGTTRASTFEDYLRAFCHALPLDSERMRYWRVLAVFRTRRSPTIGCGAFSPTTARSDPRTTAASSPKQSVAPRTTPSSPAWTMRSTPCSRPSAWRRPSSPTSTRPTRSSGRSTVPFPRG